MTAPVIESGSIQTVNWGGTTAPTVTISTTTSNLLVLAIGYEHNGVPNSVVSVISAGLTFSRYTRVTTPINSQGLEIWTAPLSGPLSAAVVTVTMAAAVDDGALIAFGATGTFAGAPFDLNESLPATAQVINNGTAMSVTGVGTTNTDDLMLYFSATSNSAIDTTPTGFTFVVSADNGGGSLYEYVFCASQTLASPTSGATIASAIARQGSVMLVMALTGTATPAVAPNIIGDDLATANAAILAAGLTVGTVGGVPSGTVPTGHVAIQNPNPGAGVALSSTINYLSSTGPSTCDPDFANVSILVHCDAATGSTVFVDSSSNAWPITTYGFASQQPSAAFFGPTGMDCPSTSVNTQGGLTQGDILAVSFTDGSPLSLFDDLNDFTIECWAKVYSGSTVSVANIFEFFDSANPNTTTYSVGVQATGGDVSLSSGGGTSGPGQSIIATGFSLDTWHALAIVRSAGVTAIYIDGVNVIAPNSGYIIAPGVNRLWIGQAEGLEGTVNTCAIDEFRITKGIARYTSNYTPVTEEFGGVCSTPIVVPSVVGLLEAAAATVITAATLTVGTVTAVSSLQPLTTVLAQSPVGGDTAFAGDPVDLTVSAGVTVPNVQNLSEAIAKEVLIAAGFVLGLVTYVDDVLIIPGNVTAQTPAAGSFAVAGTPVNVSLSQGRTAVPVPDLIGLTQAQAIAALTNLGLLPGAIGVTSSTTVPAGEVISQNIGPGIPYPIIVAVGSLVGFVVSSGPPPTDTLFNYEPTVISQYANSPTLLQWLDNMNQYMDQSTNFANFLSYVWNVDSAVGFGLDIWGKIVNVSRLLRIPNSTPYVGFDISSESQPDQDWTPAGSNQPPYNDPPVGGAFYTGHNATEAYLLDDNSYRQLILAKAFANICSTTAPAINQILQNLYGAGQAYVLSSGVMSITYNFNFTPSPIQLAILEQSGVIPTPPGVAFSIVTP